MAADKATPIETVSKPLTEDTRVPSRGGEGFHCSLLGPDPAEDRTS